MECPSLPEGVRKEVLAKVPITHVNDTENELHALCESTRDGSSSKVLKLERALYGLKQASKMWCDKLKSILEESSFVQSISDPCVFLCKTKEERRR